MHGGEKLSLEEIRTFLGASREVTFEGQAKGEVYDWVARTLQQHGYNGQTREAKGLLRRYVAKVTGLSRAQSTRLIGQYAASREVRLKTYRRHRFASRFDGTDIELLANVDEAHETLSGPATRQILQREFRDYGRTEYESLATISAAHIYNLRKSRSYLRRGLHYRKTRPVQVAIGERRKPNPEGRPGYLRVDTVHQGDRDGVKGMYHINAVDEVTQWEVAGAVSFISEAWLEPLLGAMLKQFPFIIRGFHSDNGSEFINGTVAKLLSKLLIEQTKSRPRRSNDNGLVEAKNGAVIRKHVGYGYIEADHASKFQRFYQEYLNPYLNFHRPCGQAELITNEKGKTRRIYRRYATPWEVFEKLENPGQYLKPGETLKALGERARRESDTDSARQMQDAKRKLFGSIQEKRSA